MDPEVTTTKFKLNVTFTTSFFSFGICIWALIFCSSMTGFSVSLENTSSFIDSCYRKLSDFLEDLPVAISSSLEAITFPSLLPFAEEV